MIFDCREPEQRDQGLNAAQTALRAGELAVIPTDTVYGVAADAFNPAAVRRLLTAKGRDRSMPPPVLIGAPEVLPSLVAAVPAWLKAMTDALWPGALTVVCHQQASLDWDLGDTRSTVAVRVPDDQIARDLLGRTGPLAVSSANLSGQPAATTVEHAREQLGESVAVYLDGGPSRGTVASTMLDATGPTPRILRQGAIDLAVLHEFNNTIEPESPRA
ncbi:L-threonylcarbamoyladenylate synthase [Aeromicrobium sp.]|uniref:L-threonylcarbamoyladenylate synthase n=1 Tax=Aeromicrobium sp. TaxID=1871063 RepID=UPI0039E43FB8